MTTIMRFPIPPLDPELVVANRPREAAEVAVEKRLNFIDRATMPGRVIPIPLVPPKRFHELYATKFRGGVKNKVLPK
jgi:hypothetical protein